MSHQRAVKIGFIDYDGAVNSPESPTAIPVVSAVDPSVGELSVPDTTKKTLDLTLKHLWIEQLPEWRWDKRYEGLLSLSIDTLDPQEQKQTTTIISNAVEFSCKRNRVAPGLVARGMFGGVLIERKVNLSIDLVEIDKGFAGKYQEITSIIDGVEEIKTLDVLKGIPYLGVVSGLVKGAVEVFGKGSNDIVWSSIPTLSIDPPAGQPFLRSGMYVVFEERNIKGDAELNFPDMVFDRNMDRVRLTDTAAKDFEGDLSNCLVFSVDIKPRD